MLGGDIVERIGVSGVVFVLSALSLRVHVPTGDDASLSSSLSLSSRRECCDHSLPSILADLYTQTLFSPDQLHQVAIEPMATRSRRTPPVHSSHHWQGFRTFKLLTIRLLTGTLVSSRIQDLRWETHRHLVDLASRVSNRLEHTTEPRRRGQDLQLPSIRSRRHHHKRCTRKVRRAAFT